MKYFLLFGLVLSSIFAKAQTNQCGTTIQSIDELDKYQPGYKKGVEKASAIADKWANKFLNTPNNTNREMIDTITIPIVVHVIYNNALQNVSEANILKQIEVLNSDFARLNSDTNKTPNQFKSIAKGLPIKFCLAMRDPQGNATTGIIRTTTTTFMWDYDIVASQNNFKYTSKGGQDAWDRNSYFNLWIVNLDDNLSNGFTLLGFAQFPGGVAATDGVAVDFTQVGTLGRTATHEVGHWLGLYHIWGDDGSACTGTDFIADTPNQAGNTNNACRTHPYNDGCSTAIMFMNYMDYSSPSCQNMFSKGQCDKMTAVLNTSRSRLKSSFGCLPANLPDLDANLIELIIPTGRICDSLRAKTSVRNFGNNEISSIDFKLTVGDIVEFITWNGSINTLAIKQIEFDNIDISALIDGNINVKLEILMVNGTTDANTDNNTKEGTVLKSNTQVELPYFQGIEEVLDSTIKINNPDNSITWARTNKAKKTGSYSMYMNYFDYPNNEQIDEFILPVVNAEQVENPALVFDVAYALKSTIGFSDTLEIYVQTECDGEWKLVYKKFNPQLQTAPNTSLEFKPTATQWRRDSISLVDYKSNHLSVKFVGKCDNQNNLYIDNISIKGSTTTGLNLNLLSQSQFQVFPNPSKGNYFLRYISDFNEPVLIEVRDITGRLLYEEKRNVEAGENIIEMKKQQDFTGNLLISITNGTNTGTRKLMMF